MDELRVVLFFCSAEEAETVRGRLADPPVKIVRVAVDAVVEELPPFDVAIIGAFAATRRDVVLALTARIAAPSILLLPSIDHETDLTVDFAALSLREIHRLPQVIRREIRARATETALRESEQRYRELVDRAQEGIWVIDAAGRTTFANQKMVDLLATTAESMMGKSLFEYVDDEMRSVAIREFHREAGGASATHDYRFRRDDGAIFWGMLSTSPLFDDDGQYRGSMAVVADITSRKLIETELRRRREALQKSEARYRALFDQAKDVIVTLDANGRITTLNPAFETLTGWSVAQWIGRELGELQDLERGKAKADGELRLRTSRGETITVDASAQELSIDGVKTGTLLIARDVTLRRIAEADLEREKRLSSLGQLATSVAHEFNNVLMSILPFAELLQRRAPEDERVQTATRHIIKAVRRGRQVSQQILRFARPATPTLGAVAVGAWLSEFAGEAKMMLGAKYRFETSAEDELFIEADRALLDQVATNLVFNARDAMPLGGSVSITARRASGRIEIAVADSGAGIPAHIVDRIFDPLFTTKPSGNGLGLTIAWQAMTLQRGALRVESTHGAGSTFTMVFGEASPPVEPAVDATLPASRPRVLIVEDDESVGEGIRALLLDDGFEVELVARGLDAPPLIETFDPSVVLLDVNLPDISGLDLYEQLHARWPSLRVIFSTGHADAHALDEVRKRHVPSIMKPYDISELLAAIAAVTPSQQAPPKPQLKIIRTA